MTVILLNAMLRLSLGLRQAAEAAARLGVTVFTLCAILLSSANPGWAATPIGTLIQNKAEAIYSTDGLSGFSIESNTEQFTVEGLGQTDSAQMSATQSPANPQPSAGDTLTYDLNILNDGDNTLADVAIKVTAPQGSSIMLSSGSLINTIEQQSSSPDDSHTLVIQTYSQANLASFDTRNLQAVITLPLGLDPYNTAISFELIANGGSITTSNNPITIKGRTRGVLELLQHDPDAGDTTVIQPTQYHDGSNFLAIPAPTLPGGNTPVTAQPVPVSVADTFSHGQTMFFRVTDPDQNADPTVADVIDITLTITDDSESETLRLTETAIDSGLFTGYITLSTAGGNSYDGTLSVKANSQLTARYTDDVDQADTALEVALIDPFGIVFDSETGARLDGFTVRLVNADTGQDALVFGDDGVSSYDASISSGGSITDGGGTVYDFDPGAYRFPLIPAGDYYLEVTPPDASLYHYPSDKADASFSGLPNGPYVVAHGSRGEVFTLKAGPPLHLDIPVDPINSALFVTRSASKAQVSQGDFMQFRVTVDNVSSDADLANVVVSDNLPRGFRYKAGSARLDGGVFADGAITDNGAGLSFDLGALARSSSVEISYIVEVGAAKSGLAESRSQGQANGGAIASNTARVRTTINNAFMRDAAILAGRVLVHEPDGSLTEQGVAGVRIYLEDGSYTVTDDKGRYHFEGVRPGTHVVQLDLDTLPDHLEALPYIKNTRFAGRAWSQFVELQGGSLWRADFHVARKPTPEGKVTLQIRNQAQRDDGAIPYEVELSSEAVAIENLRLTLMIPEGARYQPGSSRFGELAVADPVINGKLMTYRLGNAGTGDWQKTLHFRLKMPKQGGAQELLSKAFLLFDSPVTKNQRTPVADHLLMLLPDTNQEEVIAEEFIFTPRFERGRASLSKDDRFALDQFIELLGDIDGARIHAIGHTDVSEGGDAKSLSEQRALVVASRIQQALGLPPELVTVEGRGAETPFFGEDEQPSDGELNRRVNIYIYRTQETTQEVAKTAASEGTKQHIATLGQDPEKAAQATTASGSQEPEPNIVYDAAWLQDQDAATQWLSPAPGELPAIPSVKVAIKHAKQHGVELRLNDQPVPEVNFDRRYTNAEGAALSRWTGVDLIEGDNRFEAIITDIKGAEVTRLQRSIHYSTPPVKAELVKDESVLVADGITPPVITLRLSDKDGYPARRDVKGEYRLNAPYRAAVEDEFNAEALAGGPEQRLEYIVERDGLVRITLEPTTESGEVRITLPLMRGEEIVKARLQAGQRDWIVVGFAAGTVGHNTLSDNIEALNGEAGEDGLYTDGQLAFFAKGKVSAKWLLTLAYDSDKENLNEEQSLFGTIDPQTYYTVYGDTSSQNYDAASREKLYLKLERDEFSFLFGDYNTDLNDTQLAGYNRALTGIKSEYHGDGLEVVVFASESNLAFVRDDIRGEGVTGPYELSRQNIVMNTEKIVIETRDRFQPDQVVETRELSRHVDYDIDYQRGTITFRAPVFASDSGLNHNFIVARYESYDEDDLSHTYGGRVAKAVSDKTTLGLTHLNEGRKGGEAQLSAADVTHELSDRTQIHAEVAQSSLDDGTSAAKGEAYRVELEHRGEAWDGRAYVSQADQDFGLGQTSGTEIGARKLGVEASHRASDSVTVRAQAYQTNDLETDATRKVAEAQTDIQAGQNNFRLGLRNAQDELGDGDKQKTTQVTAGASRHMLDNKLTVGIDREQAIDSPENLDFPDATRLNADYRLTERTSLFAQQEWTDGELRDTRQTRLGLNTRPWEGGELFTGVNRTHDSTADTTAADLALTQQWLLTEQWSVDLGFERSKTLSSTPVAPFDADVPFAHGNSSDFTATSVGVTYNPGDWLWTARAEQRNASNEDSWLIATSLQTNPSSELSVLTSVQLLSQQQHSGVSRKDASIRADMAYRPLMGRWMVLDRLELIRQSNSGGGFDDENWRIINQLNSNYYLANRWQLSLQHGIKYIQETLDQQEYSGVTNLYGMETRYDLSRRWDVGFQASMLHSVGNSQMEYSSGLSVGHSFADNIWVSLGYNVVGFRDEDFSAGNYTAQGLFLRFRMKFDQASVKQAVKWVGQ
mgnify:CR=1 FL=1